MRKRGGRRRAIGTWSPLEVLQVRNERWSLDFVSDALSDGRRFRILPVIDDFLRACLELIAEILLSGAWVSCDLDEMIGHRGKPRMISDNGTELTSNAMLAWQKERGVGWHRIARLGGAMLCMDANRCKMRSSSRSMDDCATSC